jgi:hypothetical protein
VDPDSEHARYYQSDAVPFDAISNRKCLILLGEPGIGKSTALKAEFETAKAAVAATGDAADWFDLRDDSSSTDRLERKILGSDQVRRWQDSQNTLYLFLDSLDEGLLQIDNISGFLLSLLQKLPTPRMRLRIASRPLDWQVTLESGFIEIWGQDNVRAFQLAPLRKTDVAVAAESLRIEGKHFIDQVVSRDVVPFAIKPVTLKFLLVFFENSRPLPASRTELYYEGCKRLCEEENPHRRDSPKARGTLVPSQRMDIASRIAAVSQLSNRSAIWLGLSEGLQREDLSLESIVGGSEGEPNRELEVNLINARESLGTGLFSSRGLTRQGWQHQTYAEYLAAYYLDAHKLSLKRLRSLILHPDGSGKVIPQLRELAVWLAGMDSRVFQMLVRSDPEVLLRSDMAVATNADRADLAKHLLKSFESGGVMESLWSLQDAFIRLCNPELAGILRPYLSDSSRSWEARVAAIQMARACDLAVLRTDLVAVALSQQDPTRVRVAAAEVIAGIQDSAARTTLRPLALGLAGDDPRDELRGYGLMATWPENLTADELFSALTPLKDTDHLGGVYYRFLGGVAAQLKPDDFVVAISWARHHCRGRDDVDRLHKVASEILERAVEHIDQASVAPLFAAALVERMRVYADCDRITAKLCASGDSNRRTVARLMFPSAAAESVHGAYFVMGACALTSHDIAWLLDELSKTLDTGTRRLIAEIVSRRLDGTDVDTFDTVLTAGSSDQDLRAAIEPLVAPILLNTPEADRAKADHGLFTANQEPVPVRPTIPVAQQISDILATNNPESFARIYWLLSRDPPKGSNPADPLARWLEFDLADRARIVSAASDYLTTRPPIPEGSWWKEGRLKVGLLAGSCALRLVAIHSPASLDRLGDNDWNFWTKVILAAWSGDANGTRSALLTRAYQRATSTFLATFSDIIDGENERYKQVLVLSTIGDLWSDELATVLHAKIAGGTLSPKSFQNIIAKLLSNGDSRARIIAQTAATGTVPPDGDDRLTAVYATAELITDDPREWSAIWPVLKANGLFGTEVLQVIAYEREHNSFAMALREDQIAEICIWISERGLDGAKKDPNDLGLVTPSIALANWWNTLINFLMYKGTPRACEAIKQLSEALPQYEGLKWSLREAEDRMRRVTWAPLAPLEIMRLAARATTPELVISSHGIRTRGAWQKAVNSELQKQGFRHELLDYGFFSAVQLILPWSRARKVDWFLAEYEKLVTEPGIVPSLIAHSFGTYIVARAMEKYPEIRFDRVIFCGSIVRRNFEWESLIGTGRVGALLNERGGRDVWVKLAEWIIPDAGASGVAGFSCSGPDIYQRLRPRFRHSDYFYPLNYTNNWIPYLLGALPSEIAVERKRAVNWRFWLLIACGLIILFVLALLLIRETIRS